MQIDNRKSPVLPYKSYANSAGAHAMDEDIQRKFERSAFNYQTVNEDDESYAAASPRDFSIHYQQYSLFNSGIHSWEKTAGFLRRSATHAKGLKTEADHPVWLALVRHAWSAPSPEAAAELLSGTQLAKPIDHSSWASYPDPLKFEALLYSLAQTDDVPNRLGSAQGLRRFFRARVFQTAAILSACAYYNEIGKTEAFLHCASLFKTVNPDLYKLNGEHFSGFFFRAVFVRVQQSLQLHERTEAMKLLDKAWGIATKLPIAKHGQRIRYVAMERLYALRVSVIGTHGSPEGLSAVHRDWKAYLQTQIQALEDQAA